MKLSDSQKDVLEDLLKHNGFDVLEEVAAYNEKRLLAKLRLYTTDVEQTNRVRGELQALSYLSRESLTRMIRDNP